jgi:hypothetical protein
LSNPRILALGTANPPNRDKANREGNPQAGDWGVMIALGPGMAAETALLKW